MAVMSIRKRFRSLLRYGNESAFTLVELLVVCLLISITLAVTVPTLRDSLVTNDLKTATRRIIGAIRELREDAVREQQSYTIYFDMGKNRVWYAKDDNKAREEQTTSLKSEVQFPPAVRVLDIWTKSDGRQSLGTATLWISRQGYMDMTVIHITNDSDTMTISFSPFLSSIKVVDGYAEFE
jgi:type II secretory pathway pseudopilin PulG